VKAAVIINKYDINLENSINIERWCKKEQIAVIGKIPFNTIVTEAMVQGLPAVEYTDNSVSREIKKIWKKLSKLSK
jgi:MinD superfamily P-loop ATPase